MLLFVTFNHHVICLLFLERLYKGWKASKKGFSCFWDGERFLFLKWRTVSVFEMKGSQFSVFLSHSFSRPFLFLFLFLVVELCSRSFNQNFHLRNLKIESNNPTQQNNKSSNLRITNPNSYNESKRATNIVTLQEI